MDALQLGNHLVRELGAEGQRDTLALWLSHHLAGILKEVEAGSASASDAITLILKLWDHRRTLPGRSWPLAELSPLIDVLSGLRADANPWRYARNANSQRLAAIHDDFILLMIASLMLSDSKLTEFEITPDVLACLDPEEREIASAVRAWRLFLEVRAKQPKVPTFNVVVVGKGDKEKAAAGKARKAEKELNWEADPVGNTKRLLGRTIDELVENLQKMKASLDIDGDGDNSEEPES